MMPKKILIIAGEPSGDLHGSNLVTQIKKIYPAVFFEGLGGALMERAGVRILYHSDIAIVGVSEILRHLFEIKKTFNALSARVERERFDLVILIDFPGFNLRFAKEIKKRGIPLIYYISPQVWAWGKYRIRTIKKNVTKMLVFFKFEEELYRRYGIDAECVGHPLLDVVRPTLSKDEWLKKNNLTPAGTTIALLPGSRPYLVKTLLPIMLESAARIRDAMPLCQFVVIKYPDIPESVYRDCIERSSIEVKIIERDLYNTLNASDFAIVASGTASLETAMMQVPMVIIYRLSTLTYILTRIFARVPYIGLPNVVTGKKIIEEFIQWKATPQNIATEALSILTDHEKKAHIQKELARVSINLGRPGASERAAQAVVDFLKRP